MSASPYIIDVNSHNFQQEVIEKSKEAPVLVDFWADWCNPCRILMPILASLAEEYQGRFYLAKINTEANRDIAEIEQIRSLPTVRMYKFGAPVDEFNGALPESQVREFIERHLPNQLDNLFQAALEKLEGGDLAGGKQDLQNVLNADSRHSAANLTAAKLALAENQLDQAQAHIDQLGQAERDDDMVRELSAQIEFARAIESAPTLEALQQTLEADPQNVEAWYQTGIHYVTRSEFEAALDAFLQVIKLDRNYQDDAGRKAVLKVFALLGESGPLVNRYRVKMANALN